VADYQPRHLRTRRIKETRTQGHVVPQIVDTHAQTFKRNGERRFSQCRQARCLRGLAYAKKGNSGHGVVKGFDSTQG
jgi:hypothetical protein